MNILKADFKREFDNEEACLEWLKCKIFPEGVICSKCKKITKHHKVTRRRCYVCDNCGNHYYPTAGTIFHKSTIPLKTWFKVISEISESKNRVTAKEIQRNNGLSYKTTCRMVKKVRELLHEKNPLSAEMDKISIGGTLTVKNKGVKIKTKRHKEIATWFDNTSNSGFDEQFGETKDLFQKRNRITRFLKLQMLLSQNTQGLSIQEIAGKCETSKRTIYRDLRALESDLGIPIWEDGSKRGVVEGFFLPPLTLTASEATIVFLAARLMQNYSFLNNPSLNSTFVKLNTIVPQPLRKEIQHILEYLEKQPGDTRKLNNFNKLIQAWLSQHRVKMLCQYIDEEKPLERVIEPYFIEPSIIGGSSYVIAYCNLRKTICAFKLERIIGEVIIEPDKFEIPSNFSAMDYLGSAWGIQTDVETQIVKLRFKRRISRIIAEFNVHPSQSNEVQTDGSLIMTLKVRDNIHFRNWIMGWADEVEVLEPETLRGQIREVAKSLMNLYPET